MHKLKPWFAVATPHEDIREGRLSEAVFAANLWRVCQKEAHDVYLRPEMFFAKTFLTAGLTNVLKRVSQFHRRRVARTVGRWSNSMKCCLLTCVGCLLPLAPLAVWAEHPLAAPKVTSLTNPSVRYEVPAEHYVVLERGDVRVVVVDNAELNLPELPGHRAGYNGIASLTHRLRKENLFVPSVAGLNFEHIHDGTAAGLKEKFEPRKFPMQLRRVDRDAVEVYQALTGNWKLESCGRYHLLEDGTIEYTFECIPRAGGYAHGYIGLFWASYIHQPERGAIIFKGWPRDEGGQPRWIEATSPQHGIDSTHAPAAYPTLPRVDADFPLTLVNHPSKFVCAEPWYFGVSHGMAYVHMFRRRDRIWIAQSPSGGGAGNPAWDFQWFISDYRVGDAYGFVMRAAYLPHESREQIEQQTRRHRESLNPPSGD